LFVAVRCLIVDDSVEFLASATRLLEAQGMNVVGRARSADEALGLVERMHPHVVLVDIELGAEDGVELSRQLAECAPSSRVVLISAHEQEEVAELLADCPAIGFLPKTRLSAGAISKLLS
jgi:DNA-binding NarL/FixJ family response regulator